MREPRAGDKVKFISHGDTGIVLSVDLNHDSRDKGWIYECEVTQSHLSNRYGKRDWWSINGIEVIDFPDSPDLIEAIFKWEKFFGV